MNELAEGRTLEIIATEINIIKEQTRATVLSAAIEVGKRLVEAKAAVEQGSWGKWLKENVDFSERKAQELMRVWQEYGQGQKKLFGSEITDDKMSALSYSQAVALLSIKDSDERADFINSQPVEDMSARELKAEIAKRKAVEAEMDSVKAENDRMREEKAAAENRISELEGAMKDRKQLEEEAEKNKTRLEEFVKKSNDVSKRVLELEKELKEAEAKLKETPEPAVVYEMTSEQKAEVEELKARLAETEKKLAQQAAGDEAIVMFKLHFDALKEVFNALLEDIEGINGEERDKFKAAVRKLTDIIAEKVSE